MKFSKITSRFPCSVSMLGAALWAAALWTAPLQAQSRNSESSNASSPSMQPPPMQQPPPSGGSTGISSGGGDLTPPISSYSLGPQDIISVTVERFEDYSSKNIVVPPDGRIALPFFGTVSVNGKTTRQVERELTGRINRRIRNPRVTVTLERIRPAAWGVVYILGSVRAPGTIEILRGHRLTEVITKAGGLTARADEVKAILTRSGQAPIPVNLHEALSRPLSNANLRLRPNDFLTIQDVEAGRISVNGDVYRPGVFEMRRIPRLAYYEVPLRAKLTDVIVAAGGVAIPANGTGRITASVQRGNQQIPLRLKEALEARDTDANITMQPGDFLSVKVEPPLNIYVEGFVKDPGKFQMQPGSGVLQALAQAGGLNKPVELMEASVQRGSAKIAVDLERVMSGDARANLTLQAEDVVQLRELPIIRIDVAGRVGDPSGAKGFRMPTDSTLLNALAWAGGVLINPQTARISILRRTTDGDAKFLTIDAVELLERRNPSQNARLQDGDLINVSEMRRQSVIISGEVQRPGPYDIKEGQTLPELIAAAGGPKPTASLTAVTLQRQGQTRVLDAYDAVKTGKGLEEPLQENDFITVPENRKRIMVVEAVNRPGEVVVPERERLTVLEAINAAGGLRPDAKTTEIALLRQVSKEKTERTLIPLKDLSQGKNLALANMTLRDGDMIVVPQTRLTPSLWQRTSQLFGVFNLARGLFF